MAVAADFRGPRDFARFMLQNGRLMMRPDPTRMRVYDHIMTTILYRRGPWQVELVCIPPYVEVPEHRHNRVSSSELALGGYGRIQIGERQIDMEYVRQRGSMECRLTTIPAGVWHSGQVGPNGAIWLSFQQWLSGEVSWLGDDWESRDGR